MLLTRGRRSDGRRNSRSLLLLLLLLELVPCDVRVAASAAAGAEALLRELETVPPHVVGRVGVGAPFASLHAGARLCFAPAVAHAEGGR